SFVRFPAPLLMVFITAAVTGPEATVYPNDSLFDSPQESPQAAPRRNEGSRRVFKDRITPHWFQNNTRFWYRNDLRGGAREFIVVDAERATHEAAFDHPKLAAALSKAASKQYPADRLPLDSIAIIDDAKAISFKVGDITWKCHCTSYECS